MADADVRVEWLTVAAPLSAWRSIGLTVIDDDTITATATATATASASASAAAPASATTEGAGGVVPLVGTSLRIVETHADGASPGIIGWALSGLPGEDDGIDAVTDVVIDVDGLATHAVAARSPVYAEHPIGASALDHVVVSTPDLERTSAAIAEATGHELRRVRELGAIRQGFHRIGRGGLIVELVEHRDAPPGPAAFWGLVLVVEDLDAACALIGTDRISPPKDAVQPGRRIATVREDVGLGLPVALMTPDPPRR